MSVRPVIMCRVRPPLFNEERVVYSCPEKSCVIIPPGEEYHYNKVFGENATSTDIYEAIQEKMNTEQDAVVMMYGATGSGKTTTLTGILDFVPTFIRDMTVEFSAVEIYNGKIITLVAPRRVSASDMSVSIRQALNRRSTGATSSNTQSSRSHVFITFKMSHHSLTLVDLAGSERLSQTGDDPERKQEAIHVNKSLTSLRDVIECLSLKKKYVPWRNSVLTQHLRLYLKDTCCLILILCCNHHRQQTNETLRFGRKATRMNTCALPSLPPEKAEPVIDYKAAWENTLKELEETKQQLSQCKRKRPHCRLCGLEGHNKRTCRQRSPPLTEEIYQEDHDV